MSPISQQRRKSTWHLKEEMIQHGNHRCSQRLVWTITRWFPCFIIVRMICSSISARIISCSARTFDSIFQIFGQIYPSSTSFWTFVCPTFVASAALTALIAAKMDVHSILVSGGASGGANVVDGVPPEVLSMVSDKCCLSYTDSSVYSTCLDGWLFWGFGSKFCFSLYYLGWLTPICFGLDNKWVGREGW